MSADAVAAMDEAKVAPDPCEIPIEIELGDGVDPNVSSDEDDIPNDRVPIRRSKRISREESPLLDTMGPKPTQDADFEQFASARSVGIEAEKSPEIPEGEQKKPSEEPDEESLQRKLTSPSRYVTPKDFELLRVIGMGAFGKVLQVRNKESKKILAMKIISKRLLKRKSAYIENVEAEKNILQRVNHPFVVTMHCSFQTREKLFIIMDFLAGGELFLRIGREGIFLEKTAAFYLGEMILGVDHLHTRGILHRDLKPENILLSNTGHVCLTDFGLAKDFSQDGGLDVEDRASTVCGTQEYMAPEMVARKGYGRAADYWSLGCISYEMLSGRPPFESRQGAKDLFRKIMTERVKMPDGASAAACKLLKGLLNRNALNRLGAAKSTMFEVGGVAGLKQHDFFRLLNWDKLENMEIEPPLSDDKPIDDMDLQHFYEEFKQMPLPRSVTEMSRDDFLPSKVQSDQFRGFSFVQPDFDLPARRDSEIEHYFNNIEEDGESLSEAASSKFDPTEEKIEPVPEKKKRPPRKRKKKKPQLDVTPVLSENGESAAESATTAEIDVRGAGTPIVLPCLAQTKEDSPTSDEKAKPSPQPRKMEEQVWEEVATNKKNQNQRHNHPKLKQNSATIQNNQMQAGRNRQQHSVPVKQQQVPALPQMALPSVYKPTPGSWAAKLHSQKSPVTPTTQDSGSNERDPASGVGTRGRKESSQRSVRPGALTAGNWRSCVVQQNERPSLNTQSSGRSWRSSSSRPQRGSRSNMSLDSWAQHSSEPSPSGDWRSKPLARNSPATPRKTVVVNTESPPFHPPVSVLEDDFPAMVTSKNSSVAPKGAWAARTGKT